MHGLLAELKRRRVFRVAGLYGVVAWIIAEVSSVVFPVLLLPEWTVTFIVVLLMLGFPVAMVLAWAFDIGPQGIERTPPVVAAAGGARRSQAWIVYGGLLVLAMAALGSLLWARLMPPQPAAYESVAVMPFANLSGDPANDYFSDGMAEELLNLLAQVPGLQVAARTSSFAYRDQNVDVREIGRALGVDAVLEGSVRRSGERVRITAQLIDTSTGYHLWSRNYDRQMADIFSVQDEISSEIVMALTGTLGTRQAPEGLPARAAPTDSVEAYTLYLQARHQWKRRGAEPVRRSIALLEEALELDPEFARAWAGLAAAWVVLPGYVGEAVEEYHARATDAARRALAQDANLAEAHAVLAQIKSHEGDWSAADAAFFFAISLDPNDATARHWYSLLLAAAGRLEEALEQAASAYDLDPASPIINYNLAQHLLALGYNDRAQRHLRSAVELGFDSATVPGDEAMLAYRRGDMTRLAELAGMHLKQAREDPELMAAIMAAFADRSTIPQLEARLDAADVPLRARGSLWMLLGDDARAIQALRAAAEHGMQGLGIVWYPEGRGVRMHPDFASLAEAAGLTDYWKQFGLPDDCRLVDGRLACGFTTVAAATDPGGVGP
jgi:adenylate cyclase